MHTSLVKKLDALADFSPVSNISVVCNLTVPKNFKVSRVLTYRSAYGSFGLLLDPLGGTAIRDVPTRGWSLVDNLEGSFSSGFTVELLICPFRKFNETSLIFFQ